jgi:hypothetical protein
VSNVERIELDIKLRLLNVDGAARALNSGIADELVLLNKLVVVFEAVPLLLLMVLCVANNDEAVLLTRRLASVLGAVGDDAPDRVVVGVVGTSTTWRSHSFSNDLNERSPLSNTCARRPIDKRQSGVLFATAPIEKRRANAGDSAPTPPPPPIETRAVAYGALLIDKRRDGVPPFT